jgi:DnaK suppressor protein
MGGCEIYFSRYNVPSNITSILDQGNTIMSALPESSSTILPPDYRPTEKEKFMNPVMLEYFRQKLLQWRAELLAESGETIKELQTDNLQQPDLVDRASAETDHSLELRTRDRERKLISKINAALEKIEEGTYGFCEETGEPISVARLEARAIATLSLEAQERHERKERTQRDMRE